MDLIKGESVILDADGLRLTSHRVRREVVTRGHSSTVSITLDSVASCGMVTRSYPVLLALALLAALFGFVASRSGQAASAIGIGIGIAVVLVVVYFLSRSAVLEISSAGGKIVVAARADRKDLLAKLISR